VLIPCSCMADVVRLVIIRHPFSSTSFKIFRPKTEWAVSEVECPNCVIF
jgi:hypothetical protein